MKMFKKITYLIGKGLYVFFDNLFGLYGWRGFLCRIFIVTILFTINPLDKAARSGPASGMKLWFFTLLILIFAICKMIFDYTKAGKEAEEKKRKSKNAD